MGISHSTYKVSLVNGEPKLFMEQELSCRNKNCNNYKTVVHTVRNPINNVVVEENEEVEEVEENDE